MVQPKRYQPPKALTREQVEADRRMIREVKRILKKLEGIGD